MSEETKQDLVHWRTLRDDRFIGSHTLQERQITELDLTIKDVKKERIVWKGGFSSDETLLYFDEEKPLVLNLVNQQSITTLFRTGIIQGWIGKQITLVIEKVLDDRIQTENPDDKWVDAIRIKQVAPQKEELDLFHEKWDDICQSIKDGNVTVEQLKNKYKISEESEKMILEYNGT